MECILCGSSEFTRLYTDDRLTVVKCANCGLARQADYAGTLSGLSDNYNDVRSYYETRSEVQREIPEFNAKKVQLTSDIRAIVRQQVTPGGAVLDVGCGRGELLVMLKADGYQVTGLEPNISLASLVEESEEIPIVAAIYERSSFSEAAFDAITFIQVVEHLEDPLETLSAAFAHLRPGGLLVVDVPSLNNPRILLYRVVRQKKLVQKDFIPQHSYYYTRQTLSNLVKRAGFDVERVDTGRYGIKSGRDNAAMRVADGVANRFGIGGITLYARKL